MTWLFTLLTQMSPILVESFKDGLKKLLDEMAVKAAETENKWDDRGVDLIRKVLKVDD